MEIEGRSAVVVGGGSGVGRGVARALARARMDVVVADVDFDSALDTCSASAGDGSLRALRADATDPHSLTELARQACPDGSLDVLVTTVGVIEELGIDELTDVHWGWAWEVNVMSAVRTVRAFLPSLRGAAGSRIVLTGSGAGLPLPSPNPASAVYTASKHALTGYSEVLRTALADEGIGVTLLVPSGIAGNLAETSARSRRRYIDDVAVRGRQPSQRTLTEPAHIGELLVRALRHDRDYVSNRGSEFDRGMAEWLTHWRRDASAATEGGD